MKKDEPIKVCAQIQTCEIDMDYVDSKFNQIEYHKRKIAEVIGLEMMKNDLIDFDISHKNNITTIRGVSFIHNKGVE